MTKYIRRCSLVLAALFCWACGGEPGHPGAVTSRERQEIAGTIRREVTAAYDLSAPDVVSRLMSLYPDSGRVVSASGGRFSVTRPDLELQIRSFWNRVGRNMKEPRMEWTAMDIAVLGAESAVMTATYRIPHLDPQGRPHVLGGAWTAVFAHRGGRWVIVHEHLSDLPQ